MRYKTMTNSEKALQMHETWNGKIETTAKSHVNSREDLAIAYTPGVAEPCKVIAKNPDAAYKYTIKANTIAVVSDGSAVLGLGNIGAKAAMPVMEGKTGISRSSFKRSSISKQRGAEMSSRLIPPNAGAMLTTVRMISSVS